ncbi:uncharacterized protein LOC113773725 [Coffea eugenioides]|uniref:uncharacterized protein LOC113773725 n=1 Tax=Coffea eugenioides TaxID=49369 RepID=UPI000F606C61|nr:uncharacterized protein LOC113773725 [Coffea eugenioides]
MMIEALKGSGMKQKSRGDADKVAVLTAWHRVDCRTREAFRRSFLPELISGYEECIRDFVKETGDGGVLELNVQDPFRRLLLHGVCEFYNLVSVTVTQSKGTETLKMTRIRKKKAGDFELPNMVTLFYSELIGPFSAGFAVCCYLVKTFSVNNRLTNWENNARLAVDIIVSLFLLQVRGVRTGCYMWLNESKLPRHYQFSVYSIEHTGSALAHSLFRGGGS